MLGVGCWVLGVGRFGDAFVCLIVDQCLLDVVCCMPILFDNCGWLFVVRCCLLLVVGCWFVIVGVWLLGVGWLLIGGCCVLFVGRCLKLVVGCWLLVVGC